jgi:hypothetical protein
MTVYLTTYRKTQTGRILIEKFERSEKLVMIVVIVAKWDKTANVSRNISKEMRNNRTRC